MDRMIDQFEQGLLSDEQKENRTTWTDTTFTGVLKFPSFSPTWFVQRKARGFQNLVKSVQIQIIKILLFLWELIKSVFVNSLVNLNNNVLYILVYSVP